MSTSLNPTELLIEIRHIKRKKKENMNMHECLMSFNRQTFILMNDRMQLLETILHANEYIWSLDNILDLSVI